MALFTVSWNFAGWAVASVITEKLTEAFGGGGGGGGGGVAVSIVGLPRETANALHTHPDRSEAALLRKCCEAA